MMAHNRVTTATGGMNSVLGNQGNGSERGGAWQEREDQGVAKFYRIMSTE